MTKGRSWQTLYYLRHPSQDVNKLVNKSFWREPAGQHFISTCQFLVTLHTEFR